MALSLLGRRALFLVKLNMPLLRTTDWRIARRHFGMRLAERGIVASQCLDDRWDGRRSRSSRGANSRMPMAGSSRCWLRRVVEIQLREQSRDQIASRYHVGSCEQLRTSRSEAPLCHSLTMPSLGDTQLGMTRR